MGKPFLVLCPGNARKAPPRAPVWCSVPGLRLTRRGLLTQRTVLLTAHGAGADAGDTDEMAAGMGQEGTVASTAAQLHRDNRGMGELGGGCHAASGACVWVAMLPRAPTEAGVTKSKMGSEAVLQLVREEGDVTESQIQGSPPPNWEPFYSPEFPLLVKMFGSLENFPNNPCLC